MKGIQSCISLKKRGSINWEMMSLTKQHVSDQVIKTRLSNDGYKLTPYVNILQNDKGEFYWVCSAKDIRGENKRTVWSLESTQTFQNFYDASENLVRIWNPLWKKVNAGFEKIGTQEEVVNSYATINKKTWSLHCKHIKFTYYAVTNTMGFSTFIVIVFVKI